MNTSPQADSELIRAELTAYNSHSLDFFATLDSWNHYAVGEVVSRMSLNHDEALELSEMIVAVSNEFAGSRVDNAAKSDYSLAATQDEIRETVRNTAALFDFFNVSDFRQAAQFEVGSELFVRVQDDWIIDAAISEFAELALTEKTEEV